MTILVTGGFGFIGSNFINNWFSHTDESIINVDKLTYAANVNNVYGNDNLISVYYDICDPWNIEVLLRQYQPRAIIHFAAESHVDNSINSPKVFYETNVIGTMQLLESIRKVDKSIKFVHVSTDEVYGSLSLESEPSIETDLYLPNSPYAASKAASDHVVRSYNKTYGIRTYITNCSNNYGPNQHKEKFIPTVIESCLNNKNVPIYGKGDNIRDWLFVKDHCSALELVLEKGKPGSKYNIGGDNQYTNLQVVNMICEIMDEIAPKTQSYKKLISFVDDRLGHDKRYDINSEKIKSELGWKQTVAFNEGLKATVQWYVDEFFKL